MAYGAIIGGILGSSINSSSSSGGGGLLSNVGVGQKVMGAAANLAGGFLAQTPDNPGGQIIPFYDPSLNAALQAAQFDALNQIGFGNIDAIPSPLSQIINRITALPIENRLKRRAIRGLQEYIAGKEIKRGDALNETLTQLGMNRDSLPSLKRQQEQFDQQMGKLSGLSGMNTDTILSRASAAKNAADLIGAAGTFATGGTPSDFQASLRDRLSRNIDKQEEQLMLRAQFGGFNPALGLEKIADQRLELDLKTIEQSLMAASGISGALNMGLAASQNAAGASSAAQANALGLAAQQANAANALNAQRAQDNALSLANGVGGAIAAIGKSSYGNILGSNYTSGTTAPASWGPGSTNQQLATQSANYGGWTPSVDFNSFGR